MASNRRPNIVYHVTTLARLAKAAQTGRLLGATAGQLNAWDNIAAAERFSKQTGRRIIIRLTGRGYHWERLAGHRGEGVYTCDPVPFPKAVV